MIPTILSILFISSSVMVYFYFYDKSTFNNICFTVSYNCVYYFSYCQIKLNQFVRFAQPYIRTMINTISNSHFVLPLKTNKRVEFVKNGLIIYECDINADINTDYKSMCVPNDYDFMIWMNNDENNNIVHKMFEKTSTEIPNNLHDYECEHIYYKFINSEIIINDTNKFNIHFKTEKYNYLVKDNVINKDFIIYFLNKHYKEKLGAMSEEELSNMKYKLNIIDHNVNLIEVENTSVLKFNKHDYEISNKIKQ